MEGNSRSKQPAPGHTPASLSAALGGKLNHCFGCGSANEHGLHLRFTLDPRARTATASFRLTRRYEGPPGHIHGGIIATVLDEAMSKVSKLKGIIAMTRHMEIDYLRPVPLRQTLTVIGSPAALDDSTVSRKHYHQAEIRNAEGDVLARSKGLFITIDPAAMFGGSGSGATRPNTKPNATPDAKPNAKPEAKPDANKRRRMAKPDSPDAAKRP